MKFGEEFLFTTYNFEHKLPQVIILFISMGCVIILGLFTLVPAILMQYTMVMHLAQLHAMSVVREATDAANAKTKSVITNAQAKEESKRLVSKGGGAGADGAPAVSPSRMRKLIDKLPTTWEKFDDCANASVLMYFFLTLLLVDFFISVLASVLRQDQADFCIKNCIPACATEVQLTSAVRQELNECVEQGLSATLPSLTQDMVDIGSSAQALETADLVIAYVFVLDVALRFAASPRNFLSSPWDMFDAVIVLAYAIAVPLLNAGGGDASAVLLLRVSRFHRFVYAMTASSMNGSSGPTRRERLVSCCRRMVSCGRWKDDDDNAGTWSPPPRGVEMEDPIAAMKAKRAAQRENGGAPHRPSNVNDPAELQHCSA